MLILAAGIFTTYSVHKRETGYTDRNGNYVKGTLEIAQERKDEFIANVEALGFTHTESNDAYMTFKKEGQISSLIKVNADFSEQGMVMKDCIFDIYFKDSADKDGILSVISTLSPDVDFEAQFGFSSMLDYFNTKKVTVSKEDESAYFDMKPIEGFPGVVVSLRTKQK